MKHFLKNFIFRLIAFAAIFSCNSASGKQNIQPAIIKKIDSLNESAFIKKVSDITGSLNSLYLAENLSTDNNYPKGIAVSYFYQAGIFHQTGYEKKALSLYYKSLQIFQNVNDSFNIARTQKEIATSLIADGKYEEARKLFKQSLAVFDRLDKKNQIANIKNSIGLMDLEINQFEKARGNFLQALSISIEQKFKYGEKKAYYNLGLLAAKQGQLKLAADYFNKSLKIDEQIPDIYGEALNRIQLSLILSKQNKHDESLSLKKQTYHLASKVSAYKLMEELTRLIIEDFRKEDDYKTASAWQDSLVKILQIQIENEKVSALNFIEVIKSQDILKVNAENAVKKSSKWAKETFIIIIVGTFALIILAVLAVVTLVNYQRQRFFGKELTKKNAIIEKNANSLDLLNKEISLQNALLEEDNNNKNKLLSIISHDLRTPLVNTKGVLNLLNMGMLPKIESDKLMQQLETQYQTTTSLLDNLLFWIKGQIVGNDIQFKSINFFQLIKALELENQIPLVKKQINFEINIKKDLFVVAEKEVVQIIFRNLINNAIKFTNINGVISIGSYFTDGYINLTVKDSGIGMTATNLQRVQAKQYFNTKGTEMENGSGFGLMLCNELVLRQGGELIVESFEGKGTTITIRLPRKQNNLN